jgi:methylated-DNA-protein-cysteine methyltransferase-like protein
VPEDFRRRVIAALATVGPGQVISYGDLAAEAGYPGAARGVGAVLAASAPEEGLTWWRVVRADGRLAPGKEADQSRRLRAEGVEVESPALHAGAARGAAGWRVRSSSGARASGRRR